MFCCTVFLGDSCCLFTLHIFWPHLKVEFLVVFEYIVRTNSCSLQGTGYVERRKTSIFDNSLTLACLNFVFL